MTARDIRGEIVTAWADYLARADVPHAHAIALELAVIAEGRGVRLSRPVAYDDPAADWRDAPKPGDHAAGIAAVRAALQQPDTSQEQP